MPAGICDESKLHAFIISDLILLCSSALSHPLYFLYIVFFSTYLLKIFSFLSPLFLTTSLLITTNLPFFPALVRRHFSATSSSLSSSSISDQVEVENNEEEESHSVEALEVYNFVFDTSMIDHVKGYPADDSEENPKERILQAVESSVLKIPHEPLTHEEDSTITSQEVSVNREKKNQSLLKIISYFESMNINVEEKKVVGKTAERQSKEKIRNPVVKIGNSLDNGGEYTSQMKANFQRQGARIDNGEEYYTWKINAAEKVNKKEWNRTLACRLLEERSKVEGSEEGMDSLWEAYEMEPNKAYAKRRGKWRGNEECYEQEDEQEEEEEEDEIVGQLCCLQAFKFSAGKMNLGVGRRNLSRISKAVKGLKWLHKQAKKVHSGDAFRFG